MGIIKVDLEVGPAMDIEFLSVEGVKLTNAITPTGSKWKISLEFEDILPEDEVHVMLVASGLPRKECTLSVKVDGNDVKLKSPEKKYNDRGYLYYEEKATWK